MTDTIYILISENGYKYMFPEAICEKYNIKIFSASFKLNGITKIDSFVDFDEDEFINITDITVPIEIFSFIFEKFITENISKVFVICPDFRFYDFGKNAKTAISNFKHNKNNRTDIEFTVIDTKTVSIGTGAMFLKSINLCENNIYPDIKSAFNDLIKTSKTFIVDLSENGTSFYITQNKITPLNSANEHKIYTKCKNHIQKYNLDYTVTSSERTKDNIYKNLENYINKKCFFSYTHGINNGSVFQNKTIISIF